MIAFTPPQNIKEFRSQTRLGFEQAGFSFNSKQKCWETPKEEVVLRFVPHEMRRPWGFRLSGVVLLEIPELRAWLNARFEPAAQGIFQHSFVAWHIANDVDLWDFDAAEGEPPPISDWVHRIAAKSPKNLGGLVRKYLDQPAYFGGNAAISAKPAWDFLLDWYPERHTRRPIPASMFDAATS